MGLVVGAPLIRQWRAKETNVSECRFPRRLEDPPACLHGDFGQDHPVALRVGAESLHPEFRWTVDPMDRAWDVPSRVFPAGCFKLVLPAPCGLPSDAEAALRPRVDAVMDAGWVDNRTRALGYEVTLYSSAWDRISFVRLLIEFRNDAGAASRCSA